MFNISPVVVRGLRFLVLTLQLICVIKSVNSSRFVHSELLCDLYLFIN